MVGWNSGHQECIKNEFTGKMEAHVIKFKRGDFYKKLRPLVTSFCDFEASNVPTAAEDNLPKEAIFTHKSLAVSFTHMSLYREFPLTEELRKPRLFFQRDNSEQEERVFIHKFFKKLRQDMVDINQHITTVLASDPGVPSIESLSSAEKIEWFLAETCDLCGKRFGQKVSFLMVLMVLNRLFPQPKNLYHLPIVATPKTSTLFASNAGAHFKFAVPILLFRLSTPKRASSTRS